MNITPTDGLTVSEGRTAALKVTEPNRDLSGTTVRVNLLDFQGQKYEIGATTGAKAGTEFAIGVTFDADPGYYTMEVVADSGEPAVYPHYFDQGASAPDKPQVQVVDSPSND